MQVLLIEAPAFSAEPGRMAPLYIDDPLADSWHDRTASPLCSLCVFHMRP